MSANSRDRAIGAAIAAPAFVRKRLRLVNYDYSENGMYFVTVCTWRRRQLLKGAGETVVRDALSALSKRFQGAVIDISIVMPDHVHAIIQLTDCDATLSKIMQAFKSITARRIKQTQPGERVWQRGFYDRIIRDDAELLEIREYVNLNMLVHEVRKGEQPAGPKLGPYTDRDNAAGPSKLGPYTDRDTTPTATQRGRPMIRQMRRKR